MERASDDPPDPHVGLSLREALALADANPGADTIEFAAAYLANQTIVLQQGELTVASDVTVDGGDLGITIDANGASRVLHLQGGAEVTLDGLTLTGGRTTDDDFEDNGGGIDPAPFIGPGIRGIRRLRLAPAE